MIENVEGLNTTLVLVDEKVAFSNWAKAEQRAFDVARGFAYSEMSKVLVGFAFKENDRISLGN